MTIPRFRTLPSLLVLLLLLGLCFECFGPDIPKANAATSFPPCTVHAVGTPYFPYVYDNGPALEVGGHIAGCPNPGLDVIGYKITATVTLQRFHAVDGTWVDKSSCSQTRNFGRFQRPPRIAGCTVPAIFCRPGTWRGVLDYVDADTSTGRVEGATVSFPRSDENEVGCGEPGGA